MIGFLRLDTRDWIPRWYYLGGNQDVFTEDWCGLETDCKIS